jgi:hypothetical protein
LPKVWFSFSLISASLLFIVIIIFINVYTGII